MWARRMDLLPLFLRRVLDAAESAIPQTVREHYKDLFRDHAAAAMVMVHEHQRLMALFTSAALEVLPVKGPTLSEKLYGSPLLREFQDLDYIIPSGQLEKSCALLEEAGYAPEKYGPGSSVFRAVSATQDHHTREIRYVRQIAEYASLVELHWDVLPRGNSHDKPTEWTAEMYALYLALHGSRHLWQPLKYLCDLRDWIACQEPAFDWKVYRALARRQKSERVVEAAEMMILGIEGEVVAFGRYGALWREVQTQGGTQDNLGAFHRCRMDLLDSWWERGRYLLRILSPTLTEIENIPAGGLGRLWAARWSRLATRAAEIFLPIGRKRGPGS
jgi:hypothetical protein